MNMKQRRRRNQGYEGCGGVGGEMSMEHAWKETAK